MTQQEAVEDRPRDVIEVGDEIVSEDTYEVRVTDVITGAGGILVLGRFTTGSSRFSAYHPCELAPVDEPLVGWSLPIWHGWSLRGTTTLASGARIGHLALPWGDPRTEVIEELDAEWERTIEAMKSEPMQSRPTAYRLD